MEIIQDAFTKLFPDREFSYLGRIKYTNHFKAYGANIRMSGNVIEFGLSKKWRSVSREIRIGLIQELMLMVFKVKKKDRKNINTMYIDLYNSFVKNLHIAIPKTNIDPLLEESFNRVNDKYFYGQIEIPNLVWGQKSTSSLGSYDFKIDTIKVSKVFEKIAIENQELLDFIMYHEILHKSHKFKHTLGKSRYHDKHFRKKEKDFEDYKEVNKRLNKALRVAKVKKWVFG